MNGYSRAALGELCDVSIGRTPRRNESRYWGGPHPWATIRDLDGSALIATAQGITDVALDEVMPEPVEPDTLLFSFKLSIGKMAFAGRRMHHNEAIAALPIRNPKILDREFLFHALKAKIHDEGANHAVLGKVLNKRKVEEIEISLPPLDEQRRIVDILNRAAKIERLRAKAQDRLWEFIPALFVKMFGDPVENPLGWEILRFGELVEEFRYGTSKKCSAEPSDGQLPILRIPNILRNVIDWNGVKFATLDDRETNAIRLQGGDILLVRTNGNPEYIGRCAVFCDNRPAAYASYLIRARLKSDGLAAPEYIAGALGNVMMRRVILSLARTTAGNYNINIASLSSLAIPVPPLDRQRRYTQLVETARATIAVAESGYGTTSALSITLMSRLLDAGA